MNLTFNRKKIGQMDSNFFQHIQPLLSYWGLQWNENSKRIEPGMKDQCFVFNGLDPSVADQVQAYLRHTGATIMSSGTASPSISISIAHATVQPVPIAIETEGAKLLYITPSSQKPADVQQCIHHGIVCKRKASDYVISFRYDAAQQIAEWISYLLIQIGCSSEFSSLASISYTEYQTAVRHILESINPSFAELQIDGTPSSMTAKQIGEVEKEVSVPDVVQHPRSFSNLPPIKPIPSVTSRSSRNGPPINPFKTVQVPPSTIDPFKSKQIKNSAVINPFQLKTHTSPRPKE